MSENSKWIKKQLLMSSTMPAGTGGSTSNQWLMGSHAHTHDHEHKADRSCCGHDHSHDHTHHAHTHDHDHDENCCDDEDHTNPKGGCC